MASSSSDNRPGPLSNQPNTIRMAGADLARLQHELDAGSDAQNPKREFVRWPFQKEGVRVEIVQVGGNSSPLNLAARNLSSAGMSVLHSAYIHVGTACIVHLGHSDGSTRPVPGKIVRCRHVRGLVHEVGIKFTSVISLRDYMKVDPMQGSFTLERVNPEALVGGVLHIEDSGADRRLVRHYLRNTQLNVVSAETAAEGLKRASEGFEVILCDYDLPDLTGAQVVERLRDESVATPVIMISALTDPITRGKMRDARASAYLSKPVTEEQLLRAVAEFLLSDGGSDAGGPVYTTLKAADPTFAFVTEFVADLKKNAATLNTALGAEDLAAAKRVCFQIKGSAASLGFAVIGKAADAALTQLNATSSVGESGKQMRSLISMCMNARAREAERRAG
jgi:two-component system response regulator FixJ